MKKWFAKRKSRRLARAHRDGFDWAALALLHGEESVDSIEARLYWPDPSLRSATSDAFDCGAADAVAWQQIAPGKFPAAD